VIPTIEVFYSLRSPYCYLLTPRLLALEAERRAVVEIRPVYPIAIRDPAFFQRVNPLYRSYHLLDSQRVADDLGIPYRRPIPDPVVQNLDTSEIDAEQPHIHRITRLCMAAVEVGRGLPFVHEVMTLIWSGHTDNWHEGTHLAEAMTRAGLDTPVLEKRAVEDPAGLDAAIASNQTAQREAGHWGVPLMVLRGEPFYGQDRFPFLLSRLSRKERP
jgi:2-hydroxychromene-2-carboxylate isomerase